MERHADTYDLIGSLLTYPDSGFESRLDRCIDALGESEPAIGREVENWAMRMRGLSQEAREEAYARTFDMSPKCTLELGWHLFGESYDRGTFLVWMRGRLRDFSLDETTDLPDHARHVLPVLGRMDDAEADRFSCACVLPAMATIRSGLKGFDSPYESLLDVICTWLESRHGAAIDDASSLPILSEQHEELLRAEGV